MTPPDNKPESSQKVPPESAASMGGPPAPVRQESPRVTEVAIAIIVAASTVVGLISGPTWTKAALVAALLTALLLRKRLWFEPRELWAVVVFVVVVGVSAGATAYLTRGSTGTRNDQIDSIVAQAKRDGLEITEIREVPLRPSRPPVLLMHFRPRELSRGRSDEIRIYEPNGQKLVRKLLFQPTATAPPAPPSFRLRGTRNAKLEFAIQLDRARDLDGSPGQEVLVRVSEYAAVPMWPRPLLLRWDPPSDSYRLSALLSPAGIGRATMHGVVTHRYLRRVDYARALIDAVYERPSILADAHGSMPAIRAYAVEAFVYRRESTRDRRGAGPGGVELRAGYVVRGSGIGTPVLLQAINWHLDVRNANVRARAAFSPPMVLRVGSQASRLEAVLRRGF